MTNNANCTNQHAWGESWRAEGQNACHVFRFEGKRGGASSLHLHEFKTNVFVVERGILELRIDGMTRRLYPGQSCSVAPGTSHRMVFVTNAEGYEFYYSPFGTTVMANDIIRIDPGWTPQGQQFQQWEA